MTNNETLVCTSCGTEQKIPINQQPNDIGIGRRCRTCRSKRLIKKSEFGVKNEKK